MAGTGGAAAALSCELGQMQRAVAEARLRLPRAYVANGLPDWFRNHLATMDSALAACLKTGQRG